MSYYQRPMGDYKTYGYAGDPGWLSSIWKGIKKVALPVLGGLIGGPIGAAVGGGLGGMKPTPPMIPPPGSIGGAVSFPGGMSISAAVVPSGGKGGMRVMRPGPAIAPGAGGACPSGYHLAKDGSGRWVRNRRMNVANPKALRRAMRRAQGFEKLAKRSINFNKRVRPARKSS